MPDEKSAALTTPLPAWQVPQAFSGASSYQVRDELQKLISDDLLGPWAGQTEAFAPKASGPGDRYLVGKLGPRNAAKSATDAASGSLDSNLGGDADGDDGELPDQMTPQNAGRMWASSMGLSCAVISGVNVLNVTASWGRYNKTEVLDDEGKTHQVWAREPVTIPKEVRLDGVPSYRLPLYGPDPAHAAVLLAVEVRPQADGSRVVELALVNAQEEPHARKDTAWLFQAQLTVTALDGSQSIFCPVDDPLDDLEAHSEDPEEQHLRLLYRNELRHANGRNVAVHADLHPGERHAYQLETRWLPVYNVAATIAPNDSPQLAGLNLSMDDLALLPPADLAAALQPLAAGYAAWLYEREAEITSLPVSLQPTATAAVFTARGVAQRIAAGIALLTDTTGPFQADALAAFRFANEAMALQRRHTQIAALREQTGASFADAQQAIKDEGAKAASWRPFQLAFVLLNLAALTDPAHPERTANHTATVDLLFFPTGGGKTEAYLGLAAFTFAIRRLQKIQGTGAQKRDGGAGVAVLMRYTLRLLTAQQFQRAATLVCAAEVLRQDAIKDGKAPWGTEPFRIGMWVGRAVAPNWYSDAHDQIRDALTSGTSKRANVLQTKMCPWCGSKLEVTAKMTDDNRRRILLHCSNGEGPQACRFSYLKAKDEGLPILTVDEEVYRLLPSLLIATVDKMAQLPWQGYPGMLFGRVSRKCTRHGYWHPDLGARIKCTGQHDKKGNLDRVKGLEPVVRLRPPDLIIQDELHLISGALGTTVGLFESAVDELCTWEAPGPDGTTVSTGPKIVASTATTKRAAQQVSGVFGRSLAVFPPQVLDVADTFFSRQVPVTPQTPGRRYLGICAHGVRMKHAEIRIAEILLLAGQTLFDLHGSSADPYMTLVGYFNATRELAGMRRFVDDDVTTRVRMNGHRRIRDTGALSDRLAGTGLMNVEELTSRISSADITEVLKRLENSFDPETRTSARRSVIGQELAAARKEKRQAVVPPIDDDRQPVDVVLATSMLQVGVDVSRFGLMVVTGQPKNTAEYIQASSRVGRAADRPGLVVTLYAWTRPRDLAHFEDFEHYHATFYRQVEALSVTPYSRRSLDRGTAAAFIAAMRNADEMNSPNRAAYDVALDSPTAQRITDRFLQRALHAGGGERGQGYLAERLAVVRDRWEQAKSSSARLGYQARKDDKQQLVGLLEAAGNGVWTDLTVPMSMRETENEINLLLPAGGSLNDAPYGAPPWTAGGVVVQDNDTTNGPEDDGDEHGGTD
ncbi:DISARM system helicase DrmA [Kitasatospora purpeofusca]|uniref:DISARM system helicase DrmA n=1 Tax=Kitasatospora purpeofusca TaxID=67352 RepID=UPI00386B0EF8|nr:DISARM system helicase DrmA [Kitasatospora purpeofusca]